MLIVGIRNLMKGLLNMSITSQSAQQYYNFLRQKQQVITEGQPGPEFKLNVDGAATQPTENKPA